MHLLGQNGRRWPLSLLLALLLTVLLLGCSELERTRKAAENGDVIAQDKLGNMYSKGAGVPVDYKQAITWYTKAAEQGYALSQANLAFMYYEGVGVPKNPKNDITAFVWLSLAAAQGQSKDIVGARDLVAMGLTPEQLTQAQTLATELQAKIRSKKKP